MEKFDEIYTETEDFFGAEPDSILTRFHHEIKPGGAVLDIGAGQGRNAFYLAEKGFVLDAIEPSKVAVDHLADRARRIGIDLKAHHSGYETFKPDKDSYAGILAFGLIQILSRASIAFLLEKMGDWTCEGSCIFITGFTTEDPDFPRYVSECRKIGKNSFSDMHHNVRTFMEPGELLEWFKGFRVIHHEERLGPEHRHGDGPLERHAMVEAVFQKGPSPR